jgi:hypothetical protein
MANNTVKKKYNVGDRCWIYGIDSRFNKSREGTVVHACTIDGFDHEHYIISIPTEIEPLLEVRTWHSISQTKDGHVGSIREAVSDPSAAKRFLSRIGVGIIDVDSDDEDNNQ